MYTIWQPDYCLVPAGGDMFPLFSRNCLLFFVLGSHLLSAIGKGTKISESPCLSETSKFILKILRCHTSNVTTVQLCCLMRVWLQCVQCQIKFTLVLLYVPLLNTLYLPMSKTTPLLEQWETWRKGKGTFEI